MHGVCFANGLRPGFAQAQGADLTLFDKLRHGADGVLDRHFRIDAVLIVKIDDLHAQTLQAGVASGCDIFRPAVGDLAAAPAEIAELGRQNDIRAASLDRLADQLLVVAIAVSIRSVEQCNAAIQRFADDGEPLFVVAGAVGA
jgi:hypothetical protein